MLDLSYSNEASDFDYLHRLSVVAIISYAAFQLLVLIPYGIEISDEGFQFYLAWGVGNQDMVLYKDIFTMYAPAYIWGIASFLEIFGYSFFSFRIYKMIFSLALLAGLYLIVERLTINRWVPIYALAFVVLIWIPIGFKASRVIMSLPYLYLGVLSIQSGLTQGRIIGLSVVVTIAGLMSQEVGGFLTIGFLPLLLICEYKRFEPVSYWRGAKKLALFIGVGVIGVTPVLYHFYINDAIFYLVHDLVLSLPAFSEAMGISVIHPIMRPFLGFELSLLGILRFGFRLVDSFLFLLPPILVAITTNHLVQTYRGTNKLSGEDYALGWIAVVAILFYFIALGRSDIPHLANAILPSIVLLSLLLDEYCPNLDPLRSSQLGHLPEIKELAILCLVLSTLIIPAGAGQARFLLGNPLVGSQTYIDSDIQTADQLQISEEEYRQISTTVETVGKLQEESDSKYHVVALPYLPVYYPLIGSVPPTRYSSFLPGEMDNKDISKLISTMNNTDTVVIYNPNRTIYTNDGNLALQDYYPRLHNYIINRCDLYSAENDMRIYTC